MTDERRTLIEAAAKEEIELRIDGKHAPWVYEALGPEPPVEQTGLTQRWNAVAEYLAGVRIDHGVAEPTDIALTDRDAMLDKDIDTLRGRIQLARELGTDAQPGLMHGSYRPGRLELPGLWSERGQGLAIGD